MATRSIRPLHRLVRSVRRTALLRDPAVLPDAQLLDAFLVSRDETAFEMLVKRHGPMVLGVCARVIGNLHDAEDAFQAVFLVLARKANSIVPRELVGNWLHGVAYRTALQARARLGRHRARERQVMDMPQPTVAPDVDIEELHRVLDQELNHLPERFRVPIVLCDLEGRSRKEVAVQLKIPEGTLSSRLAKGRELLSARLARHGLVLSAAALATTLVQHAAAAMQPGLAAATAKAAVLTASGQSAVGLVSAEAVALSQGVMKTMFLNKLNVIGVLVLGLVLGAIGAGFIGVPGQFNSPAAQAAPPPQGTTQPKQGKQEEPLEGNLLLDSDIQKELRLSKNQVQQVQAVADKVNAQNAPKRKEMEALQKEMDALNKRIGELQTAMVKEQDRSLSKAAPEILSSQAVTRLRQIQRQQRSLDQVLEDPKMRHMLKIDDEQWKKIETILKTEPRFTVVTMDRFPYFLEDVRISPTGERTGVQRLKMRTNILSSSSAAVLWADYSAFSNTANEKTLRQLFDVLNPAQQRMLLDWVGEPFQESSWKALQSK